MKLFLTAILLLISIQGASANSTAHLQPIEKAKELMNSGRPGEAIGLLSAYRPASAELPLYHYTWAKALILSKRSYESIEHLRLAYIFSLRGELQENSLLDRADAYLSLQNYVEASDCFRIFLKIYPDSSLSERAHYGLAESLYQAGFFNEAVEHYQKAGDTSSALSGKANALQALGKVKEANDLYTVLSGRDPQYVKSSHETRYHIGENLRLMGKFDDAKRYLTSIREETFKCKAALALGLIATEQSQFEPAIRFFNAALQSREKEVRRKALLSLANVHMNIGRVKDAESNLLEIRNKYPYGKDYDSALFMLAGLYKKDAKFHEATEVLKELVFRRFPDPRALDEFEAILIDAKDKDTEVFLHLWQAVGHWLLDPSRSEFLLKVSDKLRNNGPAFTEVCKWLLRYGSDDAKNRCSLFLADYYADMGDAVASAKYLERARVKEPSDDLIRIKAKMYHLNSEDHKAAEALLSIKAARQDDIVFLSGLLTSLNNAQDVVAFYERTLDRVGGFPSAYIALADKLAEMGRKTDALRYYKEGVALKQSGKGAEGVDTAWAYYRISMLAPDQESVDALAKTQKGSELMSRVAVARVKEWNISEKMGKVF
ncbi:MAG: tetratricopeptide repeat protein [Thermodesulfovibrionales bacterium]|jgi:tetratricopeptide (TPR) repeat protein